MNDSVHPNSLANLRPIPADLRSDNTGKTYKFHPRREARRLLNRTGTELLERLEKIGLNSEAEANAIRAIQELFNRGFGKPTETVRHSGSIQHNLTGFIAFADIANFPGGFPAMKEAVAKGQYLPCEDGVKLNPDFVEIAEGGSESQETE